MRPVNEFKKAVDFWRWCWDCGARDQDCRALGSRRKCCPDCRHRDTRAIYLAPLFVAYDHAAALEDAAQTVCVALDNAGALHATTGGSELAALISYWDRP